MDGDRTANPVSYVHATSLLYSPESSAHHSVASLSSFLRNKPSKTCFRWEKLQQQKVGKECITVGCVPPAAVAVCCGGGVCLSACWDTPPGCGPGDAQVWACSPLGVSLERPPPTPSQTPQPPPRPDPSTPPPPGFRPGDLQGILGYHTAPPPPPPAREQNDRQTRVKT